MKSKMRFKVTLCNVFLSLHITWVTGAKLCFLSSSTPFSLPSVSPLRQTTVAENTWQHEVPVTVLLLVRHVYAFNIIISSLHWGSRFDLSVTSILNSILPSSYLRWSPDNEYVQRPDIVSKQHLVFFVSHSTFSEVDRDGLERQREARVPLSMNQKPAGINS